MNPFLTGSRVYGTPREDSDVDLVVPTTDKALAAAIMVAMGGEAKPAGDGNYDTAHSIRIGRLNLILLDPDEAERWRSVTTDLQIRKIQGAPVPRREAIAAMRRRRARCRWCGHFLSDDPWSDPPERGTCPGCNTAFPDRSALTDDELREQLAEQVTAAIGQPSALNATDAALLLDYTTEGAGDADPV